MFPIVGIGASAGGLEAVSQLLGGLSPRIGIGVIVVQHLDPDHPSLLAELLAKRTRLTVASAGDGMVVEPDRVYVIPPGATLTLVEGDKLHLTPRGSRPERFMPVDALFRSLAEIRGESAIGVVLSGGDTDGALGLEMIKHAGGITFAEEPGVARFPSMPRSAIETGCVDFVLPPSEIARELVRLAGHPYLHAFPPPEPAPERPPADAGRDRDEEEELRRIFRRLRAAHGVDFTHYKRSTLRRRLARRMALQKIDDVADYVALVESDGKEATALYQDFLIRVTGFFRDPETFVTLAQRVFPVLCEGRSPKEPIRIWVPGCASGEEVYSIAIALVEYLGDRHSAGGVRVFGTDLSDEAIERARAGVYLDTITQQVSGERLERFFVKQDSHYRIAKSIRDLCIFARQDVTRDPPFSRLDLVSCRNVLIYLDAASQRRVMQGFHYALRPHGFLVLGPSESVGQAADLFELVEKAHRVYAYKAAPPGTALELGSRRSSTAEPANDLADPGADVFDTDSGPREADRLLLARFAPPSLLVDDALNILQFRGETGPYLAHASGPSSLNLSRVVRPELLVELIPAIQQARETGDEVRRDGLQLGDRPDVSIVVSPLQRRSPERCFLILFEDGSRPPSDWRARAVATSAISESEKDRRLAQAEREVAVVRDYLQAKMEEHEAVKEELKSAHEEVLSANEEFQSTNEELETAKEELQSANEELTTMNEELRNRNRELAALNAEIENARKTSEAARAYADEIIETVRAPLLVLDSDLRVVRANQAFYTVFQVERAETEGLPVYDVGNHQWDIASLRRELEAAFSEGAEVADREVDHFFPGIGRRVMSLSARRIRGDAERGDLLLVAIEDITARRTLMSHMEEESRRKDEFLAMLAHELRNPLSPILHAIHLLQRGGKSESAAALYEMIERQTQVLRRLVDDLLDTARIGRGLIELRREPVDLVAIVRLAAQAIQPHVEDHRHALSLSLPDAPVRVDGDPVRLEQVVFNLLENAVKYTPPGGQIALSLTRRAGEAVLSVSDTGIGLEPGMCEKIFDLFTQADTSLVRTTGGLGLGLTLVRRLLAQHGGSIEAHSAGLGKGSEFVARLPLLAQVPEALHEQGQEREPRVAGTRRRRVLIVDDNDDAAKSMEMIVRAWGHPVEIARDGPEALAIAARFQPEIALVDIGLPGMNGYELASRLRADLARSNVKLVAVTGYGRASDRIAARAAGFDAHLTKPADIADLERLLADGCPSGGD